MFCGYATIFWWRFGWLFHGLFCFRKTGSILKIVFIWSRWCNCEHMSVHGHIFMDVPMYWPFVDQFVSCTVMIYMHSYVHTQIANTYLYVCKILMWRHTITHIASVYVGAQRWPTKILMQTHNIEAWVRYCIESVWLSSCQNETYLLYLTSSV